MKDSSQKYSHSSYGLIRFSRFQGRSEFFGVEPVLDGGISMVVSSAKVDHHLGQDWFFADKQLLEIRMSTFQFSELITSLNMGSGVPCTLEYVAGQEIEKYQPMPPVREKHDTNLSESTQEISDRISKLEEQLQTLLEKGKAGKKDLENLRSATDGIRQQVESNLPFVVKCFSEEMDSQVNRAKIEFSAYVDQQIISHGLQTLGLQPSLERIPPQLEPQDSIEE